MIFRRLAVIVLGVILAVPALADGEISYRFSTAKCDLEISGWWKGNAPGSEVVRLGKLQIPLLSTTGQLVKEELDELKRAFDEGKTQTADQRIVGRLILSGEGKFEESPSEAMEWLSLAAARGDADAQNDLAAMYLTGMGSPQNFDRAFYWYTRSASQGSAWGQLGLGLCYLLGYGTAPSDTKARWNFNRAAGQHLPTAELLLAFQRLYGGIVEVDESKAYEWLCLAYAHGGPDVSTSARRVLDVLRAELRRQLSDKEIRFSQTDSRFEFQKDRNEEVTVLGPGK